MITNLVRFLSGKKTYLVSSGLLVYAAGIHFGWWTHSPDIDLMFGGAGAMTIRAAIKKLCLQIAADPALDEPINPSGLMKILLVALLPAFLFAGCGTFGTTARTDVQKALPYIRPASGLACAGVLQLAVSSKDRADVAADIYTIAGVINSLSGGAAPTPEAMEKAIAVASPKSSEFTDLATTLGTIYAGVFPQIKGDPALALQVLQALAAGAIDAANGFVKAAPGNAAGTAAATGN